MIPLNLNIPHGFCQCGCGKKTKIAPITSRAIGWVKGQPTRYIMGHANRQPRLNFSDAKPFKINGVECKLLSLTKGMFAIVDASRYDELSQLFWYAAKTRDGYYAVRKRKTFGKKTGKFLYLHRHILGLGLGDALLGDHENGVTLDCRDDNLRRADTFQSQYNQKTPKCNKSGRKGVWYDKERDIYAVRIKVRGVQIELGRYKEFDVACAVREAAEKKYHGEFARKE